jgi:Thiamine pyrophosphate enzyme, N-terminal TPP binding domain
VGDADAYVEIMIFSSDQRPAVAFTDPEPTPAQHPRDSKRVRCAVIVQHTRRDSRQSENSLLSTMNAAGNVSDFLVKRLAQWGVQRIYGFPGDGINGIMGALNRAGDAMRFVQTRHEEMAAFMACAHSKFTGEVGVCLATSGPGAIHLLNGLYDAKMDHQSVLAIVGQQARAAIGGAYQQEVDLISLFKDVASEFVFMASDPAQIRHLVGRAMRIAKIARTVTCIVLPNDLQELDAVETPPRAWNDSLRHWFSVDADYTGKWRAPTRSGRSERREKSGDAHRCRRARRGR